MKENELNDYVTFGKEVIGIISSFSTSDKEKIKEILDIIDKYSDVKRDYNACIGMFS